MPPEKKSRAFPTGNALLYILLLSVVFNRKFYKQRNSQRPICDMQFTVVVNESNRELRWQGASYSGRTLFLFHHGWGYVKTHHRNSL